MPGGAGREQEHVDAVIERNSKKAIRVLCEHIEHPAAAIMRQLQDRLQAETRTSDDRNARSSLFRDIVVRIVVIHTEFFERHAACSRCAKRERSIRLIDHSFERHVRCRVEAPQETVIGLLETCQIPATTRG